MFFTEMTCPKKQILQIVILILGVLCHEGFSSASDPFAQLKQWVEKHSPELESARAELDLKRASTHTAISRWLPRLDLQLSQNLSKDYSILTGGTLPPQFASFTPQEVRLAGWAIRATLPVFRRSIQLGLDLSIHEKRQSEARLDEKIAELDWKLRSLYGNYLLSLYRVATVKTSIDVARSNQKEAKLRFSLGQRTKIDVLRSDANVLSLESKQYGFQQQKTQELHRLWEFAGMNEKDWGTLSVDLSQSDEKKISETVVQFTDVDSIANKVAPYLNGDGVEKRITENNPSYRAILADSEVADSRAASMMASEWPDLSFQGSYFKQAREWSQVFNGGNHSYSAGLVLTIPLSLGGALYSTYREKAEIEKNGELRRESASRQLKNEVENERLQILSLARSAESLRLNVQQFEEIVRLSRKSYELGRTTLVELLNSENDWLEAKLAYAKARLELSVLIRRFAANLGISS